MQQKKRILLCFILIFALILPGLNFGSDALTSQQQYFFDYICPRAAADSRNTGILASVTLSQAIIESGWGGSSIAQNAKNLFGMRAYESYTGKVYNSYTQKVYSSMKEAKSIMGTSLYNQYYNKFWRAYSTWDASINAHSELFNTQDRYKNIRKLTDYTLACHYLVAAGYCNDLYTENGVKKGYGDYLIRFIEDYDLDSYDVSGSNPINESFLVLDVGDTYTLGKRYTSMSLRYVSGNTSVATVDSNGKIKALKEGVVSIKSYNGEFFDETYVFVKKSSQTAYYGYTNEQVNCRVSPTTSSNVVVKFGANMFLVMIGSPDSNGWYRTYSLGMDGPIAGYAHKDYIRKLGVFNGDNGKEMPEPMSTPSYEPISEPSSEPSSEESSTPAGPHGDFIDEDRITLVVGDTYTPDYTGSTLTFTSGSTSVATVDSKGKIKAVKAGAAVIKAVSGGKEDYIYVYVRAASDTLYNGTVKSTCNFRSTADSSSSGNIIGRLNGGSSVILAGKANSSGWYHVYLEDNGRIINGYAYRDYITLGSTFTGDNKEQGEESSEEPIEESSEEVSGDTYTSDIATNYAVGHTTARLSHRASPSLDGKWINSFLENTRLLLVDGLVETRWTHCVGIGEDGKVSDGYSAMKGSDGTTVYIKKDGNFMDTVGVKLTEKNGYIYGIKPSTTVSQLGSIMKYATVRVYSASGTQLASNALITNGCKVQFLWCGKVYVEKKVIILGDVNNDGKVTVDDYLKVRLSILGAATLSDVSKKAACVTGGSTVSISDYIAIRLYILGKYKF